MSDSTDTFEPREPEAGSDDGSGAAAPSRRIVGVVRVLRGRLAAPCRCCSEASALRKRRDDDSRD